MNIDGMFVNEIEQISKREFDAVTTHFFTEKNKLMKEYTEIEHNKPLVSVVMPAYNAEKYVSDAIESILSQTYENFEFIIVEDSSTDGTLDVIRQFDDDRILVMHNERNMGIAYSTNKAISECRGKYIALIDDDDIATDNRLELQVNYLETHEEIDILGGGTEDIDKDGNHIKYQEQPLNNPKYIRAMLLFTCRKFSNGTAMIRKLFLDKNRIEYKDGYCGMQDYLFYVESSKVGVISSIDSILLKRRIHPDNETTRQLTQNAKKRAEMYKKIRRFSLGKSGFRLSEKQYCILEKVFTEEGEHIECKEDLELLVEVLKEILKQGHDNNVDNLLEIELVIKKRLAEVLYKSDLLNLMG